MVVTGYGEPHASRARLAGADAVLTKPVPWRRLIKELVAPTLKTRGVIGCFP